VSTASHKMAPERRVLPGWPHFGAEEIEAAARVLASGKVNYWTGAEGRGFESEFAALAGCRYGVAVANGTLALELALYTLGVGEGDDVVTTARTFIASASCAVMRGARPVIADVDRESQNVTAATLRAALTPRTRAIIAVHLAGWPCDMDPIMELGRERGIKVIEDCAQATGALYKGRPVGSLGDLAAFSFCQDKIITTGGEGGMLTLNDDALREKAWGFKDHGKSYDAVYRRRHAPGFRWLHESFGTNWRITEMQSAIGRAALRKLPEWLAARRRNAAILTEHFRPFTALRLTEPPQEIGHAYYKYYAFVQPERLKSGWTRDRIVAEIEARGVPCYSGSCSEIYLEKAFPPESCPPARLPVARELGETSIMFLVHPTLSEEDMHYVGGQAQEVFQQASS
jgi:dTDP-4-amino-4,6-dideoxygalactose transaminase